MIWIPARSEAQKLYMKGVFAMEKPRIKHYGKVIPAVIDFPIEYLINFLK